MSRKVPGSGSFIVSGESGIALHGPRLEEFSESSRLRGVHFSSGFVVGDNGVVVIDVGLQDTLSRNGIGSLLSEVSKFLSPSGDSLVL